MDPMIVTAFVTTSGALGVGLIGALSAHLVARRNFRAELAKLQAQSSQGQLQAIYDAQNQLSRNYHEDIAALRDELDEARRIRSDESRMMQAQIAQLVTALSAKDEEIAHLKKDRDRLELRVAELEPLRARVAELEQELRARLEAAKQAAHEKGNLA